MKYTVFALLAICCFGYQIPDHLRNVFVGAARDEDMVTYEPPEFPCVCQLHSELYFNYTIEDENNVTTMIQEIVQDKSIYGFMEKAHYVEVLPDPTDYISLTRFDLNETENGVRMVPQFILNDTECTKAMLSMDDVVRGILDGRSVFYKTETFMGKNETTFQGEDCSVYYNETGASQVLYYVDSQDYLIGFSLFILDGNTTSNWTAVFRFDTAPTLASFVMDQTGVSCDDAAYQPPADDFACNNHYDFPSSSSAASSSNPSSSAGSGQSQSSAVPHSPSNSDTSSASSVFVSFVLFFSMILAVVAF